MLTMKTIPEIIEKHSEFYICANSCNKFVSVRSWQIMKLLMILLLKGNSALVAPFQKAGGLSPSWNPVPASLVYPVLFSYCENCACLCACTVCFKCPLEKLFRAFHRKQSLAQRGLGGSSQGVLSGITLEQSNGVHFAKNCLCKLSVFISVLNHVCLFQLWRLLLKVALVSR